MSVLGTVRLSAQIIGHNIVVTVTPDHQDWNYKVGEKANFTINVRKSGTLLNNVKVDYVAGPVMFPDTKKSITLKDGTMKWSGAMNSKQSIQEMYVTVNAKTSVPSQIKMKHSGKWYTINVTGFSAKNQPNSMFTFNSKDYPSAEIIDLR